MTTTPVQVALPTRRSTLKFATRIAKLLSVGDLLILSGALGTGKTFFTRGVARALGLPHSLAVTSPTFALVQELETTPPIVHADLYRLNAPEQLDHLGLGERRNDAALFVEWGEAFAAALGGDALVLRFERSPRSCTVSATGVRSGAQLEALARELSAAPEPRLPVLSGQE